MANKLIETWRSPNAKYLIPLGLCLITLVLLIILSNGTLVQRISNNLSWLSQHSPQLIFLALGAGIVLSTGNVDISFIGVFSLSSVVFAILLNMGIPLLLCIPLVSLIGILSGIINGYIISRYNAPSLVLTWAIGQVLYLVGYMISSEIYEVSSISLNRDHSDLSRSPLLIAIVLFFIIEFIRYSGFLKKTSAVGSNKDSATYLGLNVKQVVYQSFISCGIFASLAGIYNTINISSGNFQAFYGQEITAIAIAVLGGTVLSGGYIKIYSIVAATIFYLGIKKLFINMDFNTTIDQHIIDFVLAATFIIISVLFGKKINGITQPVHIIRHTKDKK